MRSLIARNETARFTTISGFKSYIFLINQSFWTGSLCFSNRKYTKIADSIKKSADIHYHVNKNTVLLIWCVALGQYIVHHGIINEMAREPSFTWEDSFKHPRSEGRLCVVPVESTVKPSNAANA